MFDQAAQRSQRVVLNPGGWLKLRPITALNLTPEKYKGMYVKIRYGSESCVTRTVATKVTPTWTSQPMKNVEPSFEDDRSLQSEGKSVFDRCENDLEVKVEPLKTTGCLRLSAIGVHLNSKVELGVLQIPLSNAISCCTEMAAREEANPRTDTIHADMPESGFPYMYVRWFPLKDPKDCVPGEGDGGLRTRSTESEQRSDNQFLQYYTPCIKLAMWWEPEKEFVAATNEDEYDIKSEEKTSTHPLAKTYFHGIVESLSASLIDSYRACELLSFSSCDIDVKYSVTRATTRIMFALGRLQLDHHNEPAVQPVVLSPTPVRHPQPTIQILIVKDNLRSKENIESQEVSKVFT